VNSEEDGPVTSYDDEMAQGRAALEVRDFRGAYRHFGQAHNIGHDVLAHHLAAHRGLLATAWKQRRPDRVASQIFLWSAAALFDRDKKEQQPA
jgi:Protein of unknown function (DUF3703)